MSIRPLFAAATVPVPATTPDATLHFLKIEHDDLDAAIAALSLSGNADDLVITRLKKRKLQIKDEIAAILTTTLSDGVAQAS
jgi:hypothetical protein